MKILDCYSEKRNGESTLPCCSYRMKCFSMRLNFWIDVSWPIWRAFARASIKLSVTTLERRHFFVWTLDFDLMIGLAFSFTANATWSVSQVLKILARLITSKHPTLLFSQTHRKWRIASPVGGPRPVEQLGGQSRYSLTYSRGWKQNLVEKLQK